MRVDISEHRVPGRLAKFILKPDNATEAILLRAFAIHAWKGRVVASATYNSDHPGAKSLSVYVMPDPEAEESVPAVEEPINPPQEAAGAITNE